MSNSRLLLGVFIAFAVSMVALAILGAIKNYSPVPLEDAWDGTVNFILRLQAGDTSVWWSQHNEHRIVLARLLFWLDNRYFCGLSIFLLIVNYLLVATSIGVFWRILRVYANTKKPTHEQIMLGLFIAAWLFQWMQVQNLSWGFQSQFFLAQLLPLCAYYWLAKSIDKPQASRVFLIALIFGILSIGTMANGILALPLMTLYALIMHQSLKRISVLSLASIATISGYFYHYQAPLSHDSLWQFLKTQPIDLIHYCLLYVGNPAYYLTGQTELSQKITLFAGVFFIGSTLRFSYRFFRQPRAAPLALVLLSFVFYILLTAVGTASGRLMFGVVQALSSRYTTPALMAWVALVILYSPYLLTALQQRQKKLLFPLALVAFLMLHQQVKILTVHNDVVFERTIAALALELHVDDLKQIQHIYPKPEAIRQITESAFNHDLSIFAHYPLQGDRAQLRHTSTQSSPLNSCLGAIEFRHAIPLEAHFIRIQGWLFEPKSHTTPQLIRFFNSQNQIIGFAIIGQRRLDIAKMLGKDALFTGYQGYVLTQQNISYLQAEHPACQLSLQPIKYSLTNTYASE